MAIGAILQIIGAVLSIIEMKERRKYIDKYNELQTSWWTEYNKPDSLKNDAAIDNIEREIILMANSIAHDIRAKNG